jgi:hypothetical protein
MKASGDMSLAAPRHQGGGGDIIFCAEMYVLNSVYIYIYVIYARVYLSIYKESQLYKRYIEIYVYYIYTDMYYTLLYVCDVESIITFNLL